MKEELILILSVVFSFSWCFLFYKELDSKTDYVGGEPVDVGFPKIDMEQQRSLVATVTIANVSRKDLFF